MSTELANVRLKTLTETLNGRIGSISAVAAKHIKPERLVKIVVGAVMRNPTLLDCEVGSIVRAVIQGAELGLEPGSALNHAYLVPFWNDKAKCYECQLQPSYMGLSELAYRSGMIQSIEASVVYKQDVWEYQKGLDPILRHVPGEHDEDPKDITHVYCIVRMKDGGFAYSVLTRTAVEKLRLRNPAVKKGRATPWDTDYAAMACAKAIKQTMKLAPKSIEMAKALRLDDAVESGDWSNVEFDIPEAAIEATAVEELPSRGNAALAKKIGNSEANGQERILADDEPIQENAQ